MKCFSQTDLVETLTLKEYMLQLANLFSVVVLSNVGVKVSFEHDKIVMTKNNVFVG